MRRKHNYHRDEIRQAEAIAEFARTAVSPAAQHPHVGRNPGIYGGSYIVGGVRFKLTDVLAQLYLGKSIEEIASIWNLSVEQVKDAIAFAQDFIEERDDRGAAQDARVEEIRKMQGVRKSVGSEAVADIDYLLSIVGSQPDREQAARVAAEKWFAETQEYISTVQSVIAPELVPAAQAALEAATIKLSAIILEALKQQEISSDEEHQS